MKDGFSGYAVFGMFLLGMIVGLILCGIVLSAAHATYQDGQVDALTGKVKYQLVTHSDSTKTWEYIPSSARK